MADLHSEERSFVIDTRPRLKINEEVAVSPLYSGLVFLRLNVCMEFLKKNRCYLIARNKLPRGCKYGVN